MTNYSTNPQLTIEDEEYTILLEASEEFEKQKTDKTLKERFGTAPEIVMRKHLLQRKLNLSLNPAITIEGSKIKNDLLLLKDKVDANQNAFPAASVKAVIAVRNNSVGVKVLKNGKREDPNKALRLKFNEIEALTNVRNYVVIVLSETLIPPKGPYKWRFSEKAIGKANCRVFTLIARQLYPSGGLYVKSNIEEMLQNGQMKKTGEFEKLIKYLQNI
jgi:hypothetical protein